MIVRALLMGALLVSPAWSEEPATPSPALPPGSFDLKSDAIRKIVRNTVSSQSVYVLIPLDTPVERESTPTIKYEPPEKPPVVKEIAPRPIPESSSGGILSAIIDTLLDAESDDSMRKQYKVWKACHSQDVACRLPPPAQ